MTTAYPKSDLASNDQLLDRALLEDGVIAAVVALLAPDFPPRVRNVENAAARPLMLASGRVFTADSPRMKDLAAARQVEHSLEHGARILGNDASPVNDNLRREIGSRASAILDAARARFPRKPLPAVAVDEEIAEAWVSETIVYELPEAEREAFIAAEVGNFLALAMTHPTLLKQAVDAARKQIKPNQAEIARLATSADTRKRLRIDRAGKRLKVRSDSLKLYEKENADRWEIAARELAGAVHGRVAEIAEQLVNLHRFEGKETLIAAVNRLATARERATVGLPFDPAIALRQLAPIDPRPDDLVALGEALRLPVDAAAEKLFRAARQAFEAQTINVGLCLSDAVRERGRPDIDAIDSSTDWMLREMTALDGRAAEVIIDTGRVQTFVFHNCPGLPLDFDRLGAVEKAIPADWPLGDVIVLVNLYETRPAQLRFWEEGRARIERDGDSGKFHPIASMRPRPAVVRQSPARANPANTQDDLPLPAEAWAN